MWMQNRAATLPDWWAEVSGLGFSHIELSHIITPAMLAGVLPGSIPVSSVHYPAPTTPHPSVPGSADDLLSSPDEALRAWAVEQGRRSIDLAASMGATALCVHAGRVEIPDRLEWVVRQRFLGGYQAAPSYQAALDDLLSARRLAAAGNVTAVRRSLDELARYAQAAGIRLGIETRLHIAEIPTLDEAHLILGDHDPETLGLWLDTGHVRVQANLGMPPLAAWLSALSPRIVATHLHDTRGLRDHLLPGRGEIDFAHLAGHLPAAALRVVEVDWYFSGTEIIAGVQHLVETGCCEGPV